MLVLFRDGENLLKMFRFDDLYFCLYMSPKTDVVVGVIAHLRYINLNSL